MTTVTQEFAQQAAKKAGNPYRLRRDFFPELSHASVLGWVNGKHEAKAPNLMKLMEIARGKAQKGGATLGAMVLLAAIGAVMPFASHVGDAWTLYIM